MLRRYSKHHTSEKTKWKRNAYSMDFASRYQLMLMGRLQLAPNPTELLTNVEKDISQAQSWKVGR